MGIDKTCTRLTNNVFKFTSKLKRCYVNVKKNYKIWKPGT